MLMSAERPEENSRLPGAAEPSVPMPQDEETERQRPPSPPTSSPPSTLRPSSGNQITGMSSEEIYLDLFIVPRHCSVGTVGA